MRKGVSLLPSCKRNRGLNGVWGSEAQGQWEASPGSSAQSPVSPQPCPGSGWPVCRLFPLNLLVLPTPRRERHWKMGGEEAVDEQVWSPFAGPRCWRPGATERRCCSSPRAEHSIPSCLSHCPSLSQQLWRHPPSPSLPAENSS